MTLDTNVNLKQALDAIEQKTIELQSKKNLIATAITNKGVQTQGNDSFDTMVSNIEQITTEIPEDASAEFKLVNKIYIPDCYKIYIYGTIIFLLYLDRVELYQYDSKLNKLNKIKNLDYNFTQEIKLFKFNGSYLCFIHANEFVVVESARDFNIITISTVVNFSVFDDFTENGNHIFFFSKELILKLDIAGNIINSLYTLPIPGKGKYFTFNLFNDIYYIEPFSESLPVEPGKPAVTYQKSHIRKIEYETLNSTILHTFNISVEKIFVDKKNNILYCSMSDGTIYSCSNFNDSLRVDKICYGNVNNSNAFSSYEFGENYLLVYNSLEPDGKVNKFNVFDINDKALNVYYINKSFQGICFNDSEPYYLFFNNEILSFAKLESSLGYAHTYQYGDNYKIVGQETRRRYGSGIMIDNSSSYLTSFSTFTPTDIVTDSFASTIFIAGNSGSTGYIKSISNTGSALKQSSIASNVTKVYHDWINKELYICTKDGYYRTYTESLVAGNSGKIGTSINDFAYDGMKNLVYAVDSTDKKVYTINSVTTLLESSFSVSFLPTSINFDNDRNLIIGSSTGDVYKYTREGILVWSSEKVASASIKSILYVSPANEIIIGGESNFIMRLNSTGKLIDYIDGYGALSYLKLDGNYCIQFTSDTVIYKVSANLTYIWTTMNNNKYKNICCCDNDNHVFSIGANGSNNYVYKLTDNYTSIRDTICYVKSTV